MTTEQEKILLSKIERRRLDTAGIEKNPDGKHSKEGCRIGDRLVIALAATEQHAIAQAREVQLISVIDKRGHSNYCKRRLIIELQSRNMMSGQELPECSCGIKDAFIPSSRTALDEEIHKARVQVLEDAADWFENCPDDGSEGPPMDQHALGAAAVHLRWYANSLTPASQQSTEPRE